MKYKILRTDKAEEQLRNIILYIVDSAGDVNKALEYLDKIESSIIRHQEMPEIGKRPRYTILKKHGYRIIAVEGQLVFYKINEIDKTVVIYAIMDGRSEFLHLL